MSKRMNKNESVSLVRSGPARILKPQPAHLLGRRQAIGAMIGGAAALSAPAIVRAQSSQAVVIGGKAFTEQYVQAEITRQLLEREGIKSRVRLGYSTPAIREAQINGDLDITWDYTWTGWAVHHGRTERRTQQEVLTELRRLDEPNGLTWLNASIMNSSYTWMVTLDYAAENCIHSIAGLAVAMRNGLRPVMASDQECSSRADCLASVEAAYDFTYDRSLINVMNVAETYDALRERRADVGVGYTTDGKIQAYDLETLEDPEKAFAQYLVTPVVRSDTLSARPEIRPVLDKITAVIDTISAQEMGYRVDIVGQPIKDVAEFFIASKGL